MSEFENISIIDLVDDFLKRRAVEDDDRNNSFFHPSEFSSCKRKIAYKYYAYKGAFEHETSADNIDPKLQRIFSNGHFVHSRWEGYLRDKRCARNMLKGYWRCKNAYAHELAWKVDSSKKKEDCQPKIYGKDFTLGILYPDQPCECGCDDYEYSEIGYYNEEILMGGNVDTILLTPAGEHIILDYKSAKSRIFSKIWQKPKPEHEVQMQCYLYLSGLNHGKFIYECKDDQSLNEVEVYRDEYKIRAIVETAKLLKEIVTVPKENGKFAIPPRTNSLIPDLDRFAQFEIKKYSSDTMECRYCPFSKICWKKKD